MPGIFRALGKIKFCACTLVHEAEIPPPLRTEAAGSAWARTFFGVAHGSGTREIWAIGGRTPEAAAMVLHDKPLAKPRQSPEPRVRAGAGCGDPVGVRPPAAVKPVWASLWAPHTKMRSSPWGFHRFTIGEGQ